MIPAIKHLRGRKPGGESGASLSEYAVLLALIAMIILLAVILLGGKVSSLFSEAGNMVIGENTGGDGGTGGGGPEDPPVEEPQTFALSLTIDGQNKGFVAIGPGQQTTIAWQATKATSFYQYRYTDGSCDDSGNFQQDGAWASAAGSSTIAWGAGLSGCVTEICYEAAPEDDPDNTIEVCADVAYTSFVPSGEPVGTVMVNGSSVAYIGPGQTANFSWTNTYPVDADVYFASTGQCPNGYPDPYQVESGFYGAAWNGPTTSCQYKLCVYGKKTAASADYRNVCAIAVFEAADIVPDPISWTPLYNVAASTAVDSNTVTISGINTPITLTLSAGSTALVNGVSKSGAITLQNGDQVQLQTTSASSATASKTVTFNRAASGVVPAVTSTWIIGNTSTDQSPTMGNFTSRTGVPLGMVMSSNAVTPSGYTSMPFSVSGGVAYIGSSKTPLTSGAMAPSSAVRLETTTPGAINTAKTVTLSFGPDLSMSRTWTVTTANALDTQPDLPTFETDYENSDGGDLVTEAQTIASVDVPVSLESGALICVNNGACAPGPVMVSAGDSVRLSTVLPSESCVEMTWSLASSTGSWHACPVERPGEDFQPAGWCNPTNVLLFTTNGTLANNGLRGTEYMAPAQAGTWRFLQKNREYTESDGWLTFSIDSWAVYCQAGGDWTPVNLRSYLTSASPNTTDFSTYNQNKRNGYTLTDQSIGIGRLCAGLGVTAGTMRSCVSAHGG